MNDTGFDGRKKTGNPDLAPPGTSPGEGEAGKQIFTLPLLLFILILLLAAAGAVLFLLPGQSDKIPDRSSSATLSEPDHSPVERDIKSVDTEVDLSEKLHETLLSLQVRAGVENVPRWGGEKYQTILDTAVRGDDYRADGDYQQAATAYEAAIGELRELLDSRETVFQAALEQGKKALAEGNSRQAADQFALALAIDPASSEAKTGAGRAASLDKIMIIYAEAKELLESGDFKGAEKKLVELLALDKNFQPGRESLSCLRRSLADLNFKEQMSAFYRAVEAGRLVEADSVLKVLKTLRRDDEQVTLAAGILAEKEMAARIVSLRREAETLSKKENWLGALEVYNKILSIAPEALAGVSGRTQATRRLKLDGRLDDTISRPKRLQNDAYRAVAVELLNYARGIEPKGPVLTSQIDKLDRLIAIASTPVTVSLKSDNSTDIVIYHVGRLGRFFSRQIILKPGVYTVVGSRSGFRDVRKIIQITPDGGEMSFSVQCEEPI